MDDFRLFPETLERLGRFLAAQSSEDRTLIERALRAIYPLVSGILPPAEDHRKDGEECADGRWWKWYNLSNDSAPMWIAWGFFLPSKRASQKAKAWLGNVPISGKLQIFFALGREGGQFQRMGEQTRRTAERDGWLLPDRETCAFVQTRDYESLVNSNDFLNEFEIWCVENAHKAKSLLASVADQNR